MSTAKVQLGSMVARWEWTIFEIRVQAPGQLTDLDFCRHIAGTNSDEVEIDLRNATFCDPFALTAIAALIDGAVREGRKVTFRSPVSTGCSNYLSRMGVADVLDRRGINHGLRPVRGQSLGDRLVELYPFSGDTGVDVLTETIFRIYQKEDLLLARALYRAVDEIVENALEYSGQGGGFLAMQQFPNRGSVAFAIADSGVGLRATLPAHLNVKDDAEALFHAAQPNTSSTDVRGHGRGIGRVIKIANDYRGRLALASGDALGVFERGSLVPRVTRCLGSFCGTVAQARLDLKGVSD